jgi:hypothetical protein
MVWRQKGTERAMAKLIGLVYALSGLVVMWAFWVSFRDLSLRTAPFARFLAVATVDHGGWMQEPSAAVVFDLCLVALFALQHSRMARPRFKDNSHAHAGTVRALHLCAHGQYRSLPGHHFLATHTS